MPPARVLDPIYQTVRDYAKAHPDAYAGSYLTDDGTRLMLGFVGDLEHHAAELRSRVKRPDLLGFFEARFNQQELEDALDAAADDGFERTIEDDGFLVESGDIDIEANRAIIRIWAPDRAAAAAKARSLYGPAVRVDVVGSNPREPRPHEIDSYELVDERTLKVSLRRLAQVRGQRDHRAGTWRGRHPRAHRRRMARKHEGRSHRAHGRGRAPRAARLARGDRRRHRQACPCS